MVVCLYTMQLHRVQAIAASCISKHKYWHSCLADHAIHPDLMQIDAFCFQSAFFAPQVSFFHDTAKHYGRKLLLYVKLLALYSLLLTKICTFAAQCKRNYHRTSCTSCTNTMMQLRRMRSAMLWIRRIRRFPSVSIRASFQPRPCWRAIQACSLYPGAPMHSIFPIVRPLPSTLCSMPEPTMCRKPRRCTSLKLLFRS